jgi:hypothetical protein
VARFTRRIVSIRDGLIQSDVPAPAHEAGG